MSLVLHYKMNDNADSYTVVDSSDSSIDGEAKQFTSAITCTGKFNESLQFNGTSDYIRVGDISHNANTISFWFYTPVVINKNTSSTVPVHIGANTSNRINFGTCTGSSLNEIVTVMDSGGGRSIWGSNSDSISIGWHHLAISWDGSKYLIYLDGDQKQNQVYGTPSLLVADGLEIGRLNTGYLYFKGCIDDFRVYNESLYGDEIQTLYNSTSEDDTLFHDLIIYLPDHGYSNGDNIYISWLEGNYYVRDKDDDSFKISATATGLDYVRYYETIENAIIQQQPSETGTYAISGLDHLNGESVTVVLNGTSIGTRVVGDIGSGTIGIADLPSFASYVVGFNTTAQIDTMRLDVPIQGNTVQGKTKRVSEVVVRVLRTKGGKVGGSDGWEDMNCSFSNETSDYKTLVKQGYNSTGKITVKQSDPYPMTIVSIMPKYEVYN